MLFEFFLADRHDMHLGIKDDRSARGRALINGENVSAHFSSLAHLGGRQPILASIMTNVIAIQIESNPKII